MQQLKYFIFGLTVSIFVQTLWQYWFGSFLIISIILFLCLIIVLIKKSSRGILIFVILGIFVGWGSIYFYEYRNNDISSDILERKKSVNYIGTGKIVNFQGEGKYIYDDGNNTWIIQGKNFDISLGEDIMLVGYQKKTYHENMSGFSLPTLLQGEFDYHKWLYMKGYRGIIQIKNVIKLQHENKKMKQLAYSILNTRKWMFSKIEENFGQGKIAGLLRGLLLGDRSGIPKKQYQSFIDSGLVHIVAVSGGNMIMLVLLLHILLFFLPYYMRLGVILGGLVFYGLLCGLDSSVLRALLMGGLTIFALFSGRVVSVWRLMIYAWCIMLIINPYILLYDMGFLLSFGALIGIVLFQKFTYSRGNNWWYIPQQILQKYFLPTLGANLGVLPVLIRFTGTMNVISILGNMIVIPFVPIMMLGGLIGSLFGQYLSWSPVIFVETYLLKMVYFIASRSTHVGWYLQVESMFFRIIVVMTLLFFYRGIGNIKKKMGILQE